METIARTFIIPFVKTNSYNKIFSITLQQEKELSERIQIQLLQDLFIETFFNYQQLHLRELRNIRGGRAIVSLDTTTPCRPYDTKIKAMQFNEDFSALPEEDF